MLGGTYTCTSAIIKAKPGQLNSFILLPLRLTEIIDAEKVNVTESGKQAILQLAGGDLRRVLNLLQSADMAYGTIDEEAIYLTAGAAIPSVIEGMFQSLLNDSFEVAYRGILLATTDFGYALSDITTALSLLVSSTEVRLPFYIILLLTGTCLSASSFSSTVARRSCGASVG